MGADFSGSSRIRRTLDVFSRIGTCGADHDALRVSGSTQDLVSQLDVVFAFLQRFGRDRNPPVTNIRV